MKRFFHTELDDFRSNIVLMGERASELVELAIKGLEQRDPEAAEEVLAKDDSVDELEVLIDNEVIRYISLRAPVATELRLLMTGMKAAGDLERVGDEACTIAKRIRMLLVDYPQYPMGKLPSMAKEVISMLRDSISAFLNEEVTEASLIPGRDKQVDAWNRENYLIFQEGIREDPEHLEAYLSLIFISKALERIADHSTNLAEEAIYLYQGRDVRHTPLVKRAL